MTYDNALRQGFRQLLNRIALMQTPKWRRLFKRTLVGAPNSVTPRAILTRNLSACLHRPARGPAIGGNRDGSKKRRARKKYSGKNSVHARDDVSFQRTTLSTKYQDC